MKNAKYTECRFSSEILPYMYGELSANVLPAFESHLVECGECTDEFAELAAARFEVYEWKQIEFAPLPTPLIAIPYDTVAGVTWVDRLRAAFSRPWAAPGFAFAALSIVTLFAAFILFSNGPAGDDIVEQEQVVPEVAMPEPPAPEFAVVPKDDATVVQTPRAQPVRAASRFKVEERRYRVRETAPVVVPRVAENTPVRAESVTRSVPTLNDFNDDEDTSLRLAELFDDVGVSD